MAEERLRAYLLVELHSTSEKELKDWDLYTTIPKFHTALNARLIGDNLRIVKVWAVETGEVVYDRPTTVV